MTTLTCRVAPPLALALALTALPLRASNLLQPPTARVAEIANLLPSTPVNFTPPISDRAFWDVVAADQTVIAPSAVTALHAAADKASASPPPPLTEELYNTFRENGARKPYERPYAERLHRLGQLLFSTAFSNSARHLPAIERELAAILDEPTWAVPAHTGSRPDWHASRDFIDLGAAARAGSLATTDFLLGNKLAPTTRERIRSEIHDRIFTPYLERLHAGNRHDFWWMTSGHNWNPVCNTGVLISALLLPETAAKANRQLNQQATDDKRTTTALIVAAWEAFAKPYLAGFGADGFCHEGIGYWNYGFGHYVLGSEWIRLATNGQINLLNDTKRNNIATFPARWQIANDTYPPFGDASLNARPRAWLQDFITLHFEPHTHLPSQRAVTFEGEGLSHFFPISTFDIAQLLALKKKLKTDPKTGKSLRQHSSLRGWFPDGGALVVRRTPNPANGLAAAFKGGHNGQPHNHNDLGSFILLLDGYPVLTDPGSDTYVKDTFGPKRYTSDMMNSRGHPVPIVAGQLQSTGREARATTIRNEFSDTRDLWEIDITSAYTAHAPTLDQLTRTFIFTRSAPDAPLGKLEIIDRIKIREGAPPQTFGTALVFTGKQRRKLLPPPPPPKHHRDRCPNPPCICHPPPRPRHGKHCH